MSFVDPRDELQLHAALQLLQQAGRELPAHAERGSVQWLQSVVDALCELSSRDPLTGLANRRQFESSLAREVDRVARSGEPALVLLADIDLFKQVNDTHGHAPNCAPAFGHAVAERIRAHVEQQVVRVAPGVDVQATVSIGGAFAPQWVRSSPLIWVERADRQLYRAKNEGRNRVCLEHAAVYQVSAEEKSMLFGSTQMQDLE